MRKAWGTTPAGASPAGYDLICYEGGEKETSTARLFSTLRTRVDAAVPGVSSRRGAGTVPLCRPSLLEMSALFIYLSSGIACHGESAQKENNNPIIRPAGCAS